MRDTILISCTKKDTILIKGYKCLYIFTIKTISKFKICDKFVNQTVFFLKELVTQTKNK